MVRSPRWPSLPFSWVVVPLLLVLLVVLAGPAAIARPAEVIVLPGASSAEGIAAGRGTTFYAGICSPVTSSAATSSAAPPSCSSTRPMAAWPWAWPPTVATTCCLSPVAHRAGLRLRHPHRRHRGQLPVRDPRPPRSSTTWPSPATAPGSPTRSGPAVLRAGQPGRGPGARSARWRSAARRPTLRRGVQPQRHPGHPQRQDPDRGPLGQRPALHGRSGHRGQRDHRRGQRAPVDGIVLQGRRLWAVQTQPTRSPGSGCARTSALGWWRRSSPASFPGADHRGPVRESPGGGQRQVRHRHPAHRRPVRGDRGRRVSGGHCDR